VEPALAELRVVIWGTVFLCLGLASWFLALIRRRLQVRILVWLGAWSTLFGVNMLLWSDALRACVPPGPVLLIQTFSAYFTIVLAAGSMFHLTLGKLRWFVRGVMALGLVIGVAGFGWYLVTGERDAFLGPNRALAFLATLVLALVLAIRPLARKYSRLAGRPVVLVGIALFAVQAFYVNLAHLLHLPTWDPLDELGFAAFLFSLAYAAAQDVFAGERRLLAIDKELEIARAIQNSILPAAAPDVPGLRIAAAYRPATSVAGDFYDYLGTGGACTGFLVADVTGHGVPAALIASMIKVAAQSSSASAAEPDKVLGTLDRALSSQLHGQYLTAACLSLDAGRRIVRYSAAGHPPLLHWQASEGRLEAVVSNGLMIGLVPESDYPVREFSFGAGDRFLLYTDGLTEAANAVDEQFGDAKLEAVLRHCAAMPARETVDAILSELYAWLPMGQPQQDDITLVLVDAV
jgi:sigma-B regulation protein RsbU (phosphoserine phosphatase)